jgi:hypothetical protein
MGAGDRGGGGAGGREEGMMESGGERLGALFSPPFRPCAAGLRGVSWGQDYEGGSMTPPDQNLPSESGSEAASEGVTEAAADS